MIAPPSERLHEAGAPPVIEVVRPQDGAETGQPFVVGTRPAQQKHRADPAARHQDRQEPFQEGVGVGALAVSRRHRQEPAHAHGCAR